ncbi:hypothetical protein WJX72_010538 [[Myrmecia] bisecta]|uniref:ADP-ribosylglycohydrolase n=1 Tax=[Myrmecia] bisecta TaxID=41462 RepID=A0AAW1P8C4_9CHLO
MSQLVADRVHGALWGIFIADSLSMPVHWYYDTRQLQRDFGFITGYHGPKAKHPGSIMSVSNTGGHGRGGQEGRVVGDIINHGKRERWGKPGVHYHEGMQAGANTLNALCARVTVRSMTKAKGYSSQQFLADYVKFMTTPGSHDDTYAESFHRDFFSNWARGVPPAECSKGTEGHNTASIGGFVMLPPVILGTAPGGLPAALAATVQHLGLTHESKSLARNAQVYAKLLIDVASGKDLQGAVREAASSIGFDVEAVARRNLPDAQVVGGMFSSACYIDDALPSVLYLAYRHADSFEDALLANTNVGGENCHRGSALGALMGAATGAKRGIPKRFIQGLLDHDAIQAEIDAYMSAVLPKLV